MYRLKNRPKIFLRSLTTTQRTQRSLDLNPPDYLEFRDTAIRA